MDPIAFSIGSVAIHWYGILMATTFLTGILVGRKNAISYGVDPDVLDDLIFKLALVVLVGARLAVVVTNLPYYMENPLHIFARPGMGSHGAIIGALVFGYFWTKKAKLSYWQIADAAAPILPIAHIFIRMGNFINGELHGPPTDLPFGVKFPTTWEAVHPTQIYEVLASLILLPFALKWSKSPKYHGYAFMRVLLIQSVIRFFLDFIRQYGPFVGPLVLTQVLALGLAILMGVFIWQKESKQPGKASKRK